MSQHAQADLSIFTILNKLLIDFICTGQKSCAVVRHSLACGAPFCEGPCSAEHAWIRLCYTVQCAVLCCVCVGVKCERVWSAVVMTPARSVDHRWLVVTASVSARPDADAWRLTVSTVSVMTRNCSMNTAYPTTTSACISPVCVVLYTPCARKCH